MVIAGIYSTFPTAVYNTFGTLHGPRLYAIILLSGTASAIFDTFLIKVVYGIYESPIEDLFYIGGIASFIALIMTIYFSENIDIIQMDRKGYIEWSK